MVHERRQLRPSVAITTRPLWQVRLARAVPRYLLYTVGLAGIAASARFAIAPPVAASRAELVGWHAGGDLGAQGYAELFARRYLTWDASEPLASERALGAVTGTGVEPDAGLRLPPSGEQRVEWVQLLQEREPAAGTHVYTVAVQTDTAGLLYLSVRVVRASDGSLAIGGYPAFVGAPAAGPATVVEHQREVSDQALATVVARALRNYLAGASGELAADLTPYARVSLPALALTLESLQRISWMPDGKSVLAIAQARDPRGVRYTLAYELDVTLAAGRWEVSAVQVDPDS
jgi:Conjugative transposon protein TcpC